MIHHQFDQFDYVSCAFCSVRNVRQRRWMQTTKQRIIRARKRKPRFFFAVVSCLTWMMWAGDESDKRCWQLVGWSVLMRKALACRCLVMGYSISTRTPATLAAWPAAWMKWWEKKKTTNCACVSKSKLIMLMAHGQWLVASASDWMHQTCTTLSFSPICSPTQISSFLSIQPQCIDWLKETRKKTQYFSR